LQVRSAFRLGEIYHCQGDHARAISYFQEVIASAHEHAEVSREPLFLSVHACSWLVYCLTERGEFGRGLVLGTEALRLAETEDFSVERCAAYASLGYLFLIKGALQPAVALLEQGFDLCRRWHNLDWFPECAASLGLAYALSGRPADAFSLLEQAVEQA